MANSPIIHKYFHISLNIPIAGWCFFLPGMGFRVARNMDSSYGSTVAEQFVDICVRVPQALLDPSVTSDSCFPWDLDIRSILHGYFNPLVFWY